MSDGPRPPFHIVPHLRRPRIRRLPLALVLCAAAMLVAGPACAADWRMETLALASMPERLHVKEKRRGLGAVRVLTRDRAWRYVSECDGRICLKTAGGRPPRGIVPKGALPDAVLGYGRKTIRRAWLAEPNRRYDHAVLGDAIEAGALVAEDILKKRHRLTLPPGSVFEDTRVRVADLDGDGAEELVVVRAYETKGAALAVVKLAGQGLEIAAETPPIGRPYRWLNPAGIADFDGDGRLEIAIVVTPHIGGTLELWKYRDGRLVREMRLSGFSNHVIGSRVQEMSAAADFDGDGVADLALPSADRRTLRIVSFAGGQAAEPARIDLPGRVVTEIRAATRDGWRRPALVLGLDTKRLVVLR